LNREPPTGEQVSDLKSAAERPLGRSGVSVPALGVGTNRWNASKSNQARLKETLSAALDVGVGFFDTTEVHGFSRSEAALGKAARGARLATEARRSRDPDPGGDEARTRP
jgi:aryl-alcohol dehydrogenase-like predicted oxidoreductase